MKDVRYENTVMKKLKTKIAKAISPEKNIEKGSDSRWCNETTRETAKAKLKSVQESKDGPKKPQNDSVTP